MSSDYNLKLQEEKNIALDFKHKEEQFTKAQIAQQNKDDWAYDQWKDNQ